MLCAVAHGSFLHMPNFLSTPQAGRADSSIKVRAADFVVTLDRQSLDSVLLTKTAQKRHANMLACSWLGECVGSE